MRNLVFLFLMSLAMTAQAITLNHSKWVMHSNQTLHLIANDGEQDVNADTWQSSNPEVATVNAYGVVTSMGEGTALITATYGEASTTAEVTVTDAKAFSISFSNISNTTCNYKVSPADPNVHYYYQMRLTHGDEYSIDSMDDYGSIEENVFQFTVDWFEFCASLYGNMTWNEVMQPQLEQGTINGDNTDFYGVLSPGTEYSIYAMGFDAEGNLVTPIEMETFSTTAPAASDITFSIGIGQCTTSDAEFTVRPSNNDQYLVCVQRASYVEWYVERDRVDDMIQPLAESYASDVRYPALQRGTCSLRASDFVNVRSNTDYYVIVFGYDDGATSSVTLKHFRTEYGWTDGEDPIDDPTCPPSTAERQVCQYDAFDVYLDEQDETVYAPIETLGGEMAVDGNDIYLYGMVGAMSDNWVKGTYNASDNTLCISTSQPLGMFDPYGMGSVPLYLVGGDMNTNAICDLIFHYDAENKRFVLDESQYVLVNGKQNAFEIYMMLAQYTITLTSPLGIKAIETHTSVQPQLITSPCLPVGVSILRTPDGETHKVMKK